MSLDKISIKDIELRCIIGISEDERKQKQNIILNLTYYASTRISGRTDNIKDCVNYSTIYKDLISYVESSHFNTLEGLSNNLAKRYILKFNVERINIKIRKPEVLRFSKGPEIEIDRSKKESMGQE